MSDWYCPLPFRHAFVDSTGISPCCQIPRQDTNLETWANNSFLKELQQETLSGITPAVCRGCHDQEKNRGQSLRTDSLNDYNNQRFTDTVIDFIDYRSSNICNFKCRSCNPRFSHGIDHETKTHDSLKKFLQPTNFKTASVTDINANWIQNNLSQINRLMFTGGEPTVIPSIRSLIETVARDYKHIMILITSNTSFTDNFWYEITETLPNLHWTVSIDAVGPASEIIRHGTNWNQVEKNVRWLAKNAVSLDINTTVTNLNIFQLKPLLIFSKEMQEISKSPNGKHGDLGCRHQFHISQRPYILGVENLSPELKISAIDYLANCLELNLDDEQYSAIIGIKSFIENSEFDPHLWKQSQEYNTILDTIRNEDHTQLYQEMQ